MGDVENIFCCKCLNALPDHVIFPCGHFVCRECEAITNCLICEQPVCLTKSSFTLRCYRQMVSDGLLTPSKSGILPKTEVSDKKKSAKSRRVRKASNKRKKSRNSLTSADGESPLTARVVRSSPRHSCNKLINQHDPRKQKAEKPSTSTMSLRKTSKATSTEQVIKSDKSGISKESTPKDVSRHVHPKKARLLRSCLSASKPRRSVTEKVGPDLDGIVKTSSPPPKKRKTAAVPRVDVKRTNLRTSMLNIDSSDEDDGIFIDSNSIVDCRNAVEVVAQVHANPDFSSQTSLDNMQTDESPIKYTQIGLGHLEQDEVRDGLCVSSGDFTGFDCDSSALQQRPLVSTAELTNDPTSRQKVVTPLNHLSNITPEKVQPEMETDDQPGVDSIIKSSVPPSLHAESCLKTAKVRKSTEKSFTISDDAKVICGGDDTTMNIHEIATHDVTRQNDNIATVLGLKSPRSPNIKVVEGNSTITTKCEITAAQQFIEKHDAISDSIYCKDTEPMEIEMDLSTSCCAEVMIQQPGDTPADIPLQGNGKDLPSDYSNNDALSFTVNAFEGGTPRCFTVTENNAVEDGAPRYFTITENSSSKYLDVPDKQSPSASVVSESFQPQHDVEPPKDILFQKKDEELPVNSSHDDTPDATVRISKHSHLVFEDEVPDCFSFAAKCSSKYCGNMSTTTIHSSSESLHPQPDLESSYSVPLEKNVNGLPANPPCDGTSDVTIDGVTIDTQKWSPSLLENEVLDCLSFAGNISSNYEDSDTLIDVTTVSSTDSLLQPKVSSIITPPNSTSRKTRAEAQPYHYLSSPDTLDDISRALLSQTSVMDLRNKWHSTHQLLTDVFSKIYLSETPKSLLRLAFDVLLLPMKNHEVFHGLSAISPVTASAEKSVQVDLFLDQTTVKVELGKDPVKRNSFTRRQLSFVPEDSSPTKKSEPSDGRFEPEESEEIVEGTPTKAQLVRVNLLNDSTCTQLSRLTNEDSPAQIRLQSIINEAPAFSIFDPPPVSVDTSRAQNLSTGIDAQSSSVTPSSQQTSKLVSPSAQCSLKDARATPHIENFDRFKPPSSTPISQPMDSSLSYTDSESIIGDSEQLPQKRKHHLALPLGGNSSKMSFKEGNKDQMSSPRPLRNISNVFQITTTGVYDHVEKHSIRKLCELIKATFSTQLTKDTTHLILPDTGDVMVTTKFLMALYNGSYILPMRWVFDCLISKRILPEADYFFNHPGIQRRMMMPRRAALFMDYAFYISPEVRKDEVNYKALMDLMKFCSCNITETVEQICRVAFTKKYKAVVLQAAGYVSSQTIRGSRVIFHVNYQWFYSCLTSYEIQPFDKLTYN